MAILCVENIPADLYAALRKQAKLRRRSIAQEVISLLEANVSIPQELERRRQLFQTALRLSNPRARSSGHFQTTEAMQGEDRYR